MEGAVSVKVVTAQWISRVALVGACVFVSGFGQDDMTRQALPGPSPRFVRPPGALLAEDFSGDLKQWEADRPEAWKVTHGLLRVDLPDAKQERAFLYAGSEDWTDYAVDLDVCGMRGVDKGVAVRIQGLTGLAVDLRGPGYQDVVLNRREWNMGRAAVLNANGSWNHIRVEVRGPRVRVFVNGDLKIDRTDPHNARPQGRIALAGYTGGVGQCTVYYDNIVVTELREQAEARPNR